MHACTVVMLYGKLVLLVVHAPLLVASPRRHARFDQAMGAHWQGRADLDSLLRIPIPLLLQCTFKHP